MVWVATPTQPNTIGRRRKGPVPLGVDAATAGETNNDHSNACPKLNRLALWTQDTKMESPFRPFPQPVPGTPPSWRGATWYGDGGAGIVADTEAMLFPQNKQEKCKNVGTKRPAPGGGKGENKGKRGKDPKQPGKATGTPTNPMNKNEGKEGQGRGP